MEKIELMTAKDVGDALSLSKRQVFRMRASGLICSPVRVGLGAIRWRRGDIEKWISLGCPSRKEFEIRKESENAK
jgi:predicted DNA-binding transcriptional regulator AlpA